jgi:hypothetical protein
MAVAAGVLFRLGSFTPVEVPDTAGYVEFPFNSLSAALSHYRTPGYPLFLRLLRPLSENWRIVPTVQFLLYCLATAMFFRSLQNLTDRWTGAFIAGSLLATNILFGYVNWLSTEALAATLGVMTAALLLSRITATGGQRVRNAVAIAAVVAAAWLVRPASLFLVGFVPVVGTLLAMAHRRERATGLWHEALILTLAVVLPVVAYCGLRWNVVGRFGIVSFGGYNLIGIAGQFLDDDVARQLPDDLQPLAAAALQRRSRFPFSEAERLLYDRMESRYDDTIWNVFTPAARDLFGDDHRRLNSELKRLAVEIIKVRPRDYAVWLAKATRQGVRKLVSDFVLNPASLAMLLTVIVLQVTATVKDRPGPADECAIASRITATLFLVAILYAAASLIVVIIVCPPLGRMTDAAAVLLGAPLMAAIADRWQALRR